MVNLPVVNAPYLTVSGLEMAITGNAAATVQLGIARNSTNQNDIVLAAATTLNAATVGLNGLDTGTLANNTLYGLYVIGDSSANRVSGILLSANNVTPLLPVGYDMFRLIGYIRTNGSAQFLTGYWSGNANTRVFMYDAPVATAVTAGAAVTDTAVTLATFVPAVAGIGAYVFYDMTPSAASRVLRLKPFGGTGVPFSATGQVATVHVTGVALVLAQLNAGAPSILYSWSAGGGDAVALTVAGYQYTI